MLYNAKAELLHTPRLDKANSPSAPEYGDQETETTEIEACDYKDLVKQYAEFCMEYNVDEFNITSAYKDENDNVTNFTKEEILKLESDINDYCNLLM